MSALWTVGWGITTACDLHCPFCYSAAFRRSPREVDLDKARSFLATQGGRVGAINFGTGETFLSPSFSAVLDLCREWVPHATLAVTTNGALADASPAVLERVGRMVQEVDVSLDFADAGAHDAWRQRRGTWDRALRALERVRSLGLTSSVVAVGTAQTLQPENLRGLLDLARRHGAALRLNLYVPTGSPDLLPAPGQVRDALLLLHREARALRCSDRLFVEGVGSGPACRLLPDGQVSPSTWLLGPPWVAPLPDGLDDLPSTPAFARYGAPPLPRECQGCWRSRTCHGGSLERRWWAWGHLAARDPLCDGHPLLLEPSGSWEGPQVHLGYLPTVVALP